MTSSGKKTRNILFFLSAVAFLPACQGEFKTTDSLCSAHPELCKGLNNNDGQCRIQRTDLIWQRYKQLKTPTDIEKLHTLEFTRSYQYAWSMPQKLNQPAIKNVNQCGPLRLFTAMRSWNS